MGRRRELQEILEKILGSRSVYFQPPSSIRLTYPCIIYELQDRDTKYADNAPYRHIKCYAVTHISRDPDDPTPDKIANLSGCDTDRMFQRDGLNHQTFRLYF
nr:MAG TPA: tail completion protein [Caudoviricetes sp.]